MRRLTRVLHAVAALLLTSGVAFAQVDRPFVPDEDNAPPTRDVRIFKADNIKAAIDGDKTGRLLEGDELFSLNLLHRTGEEPTIHGSVVDLYFIQKGSAILEHGGTSPDAKLRDGGRDGDMRGTVMQGATRTRVAAGDIVFIPPGVPHRFVEGSSDVVYFNVHFPGK
jgi:AraC-like ligand binding domain